MFIYIFQVDYLPVNRPIIPLRCNDLRCEVVGGPTERPGNVGYLLGETEVGNLQMPVPVQQQVLGLQISIDNVHRV